MTMKLSGSGVAIAGVRRGWPRALVVAVLVALAGAACRPTAPAADAPVAGAQQRQYRCTMHPSYLSDKPGDCPICGMKLVPVEAAAPARRIVYYRSPMDPSVHSATPAKDAMGMEFLAVYADEASAAPAVSGRTAIVLSGERRELLGVHSARVRQGRIDHTLRSVGRVAVDERRVHHVHTKFEGYAERLYVDFTGKYVKQGEPLLSIYSPELVATQQEYLLALRAQREMAKSGAPAVAEGGLGLLEAARQRLLFWDIRPQDIARLEATGEVMRTLDLHAEMSGFVVQKMAFHGMRVTPNDALFDIADLSQLWVLADVYESDLPLVRLGMPARLSVRYLPGREWHGPVTNIAPTVEEKTRTVKVRVEVDNTSGELKPDMFADVTLVSEAGLGLLVARSAVIDAGERQLVFVDLGDGRLEPRAVQVGARVGDEVQVVSGLAEGEMVVTSANFLLDSESSLKAAIAAMEPAR